MARFAQSAIVSVRSQEFGRLLQTWLGDDSRNWPSQARNFIADKGFSLAPVRLGLGEEIGVLVACSQRADFPREMDKLLLSVAANQAVIALQEARELSIQRRIANGLDERVAQRTVELTRLIDIIPGLVAVGTAQGEVEFLNRRTLEYFGRALDELKEWATSDAVHPDDRPQAVATWRRSVETGQSYNLDQRLRRADGVYRWFHAAGSPLRDANGCIVRWYLLLTDIHERKVAEERLRQDENELRKIQDAIPDSIHVFHPDGTVFYVNKTALDYSGLTLVDAQREDYVARLVHPDDFQRIRKDQREALTRAVPFDNEIRLLGRDGKYRWFLGFAGAHLHT
jgi:PAS domain S-box-containing protein